MYLLDFDGSLGFERGSLLDPDDERTQAAICV